MKPRNPSLPPEFPEFECPDEESDEPPVKFVETLYIGPAQDPHKAPDIDEFNTDELGEDDEKESKVKKKKRTKKIKLIRGIRGKVNRLAFRIDKTSGVMTTDASNPMLKMRIRNISELAASVLDASPKKKKPKQ